MRNGYIGDLLLLLLLLLLINKNKGAKNYYSFILITHTGDYKLFCFFFLL
jgi:hypothetical protein